MEQNKNSRKIFLSILGILLIGGLVTFNYMKTKSETNDAEQQIGKFVEQQDKKRKTATNEANSPNEQDSVKNTVRNYIKSIDEILINQKKLNMGYDYMTHDLAEEVKSKYEKDSKEVFNMIKKEKYELTINNINFTSFQYRNDEKNEIIIQAVYQNQLMQDSKVVEKYDNKFEYVLGKSPEGLWLISYYQEL